MWTVDGYTLLHSGRTLPDETVPQVRNEGVSILLDRYATMAWKNAGETWEAVSSHVVTARLKVIGRGQRRPGGSRETSSTYMSVVSAYAPTAKAPLGVKAKFFDDLQDALDRVPAGDILVVLGGFNARVGKREGDSDVWREVRGKHGVGSCNEAGARLLEFCGVNDLTIMNTWFEKPQVHLATWKHPATKQAHMIDFVLMRKGQRRLCRDVRVCRSACCWSDHHLVRGKVQLPIPRKKKVDARVPLAVHSLSSKDCREEFQQTLCQLLLQHPHCVDDQPEDNWERLKKCIVEAAEDCLGRARKRQPDWFLDATDTLMPLVATKRRAHCKFLHDHNTSSKKEFRRHQRIIKKLWMKQREAELARNNGKQRWTSIRKLQMAHVGRRPTQSAKLYKRDGGVTSGPEEVKATWHQHFTNVLNIPSEYCQEVLDNMPSLPPVMELDHHPTSEELVAAMSKLKRGKAGPWKDGDPTRTAATWWCRATGQDAVVNERCMEEGEGSQRLARCRNSPHTQEGRS